MKIEVVVFDLDGTIYDKKGLKFQLILSLLFRLKMLTSLLSVRKEVEGVAFGSKEEYNEHIVKNLAEKSGKSKQNSRKFIQLFYDKFVNILHKKHKAENDITEAINYCSSLGIKIVCLSDFAKVEERLLALGVDVDKFSLLKSSEDYGALKPSPVSFLSIAKQLDVNPENVLVVGDREDTDGDGARASGMQFLKYPEKFNEFNKIINHA